MASQVAHWSRICLSMQETQEHRFDPSVGKVPWRRKWQPTPVVLPGKFHGWKSLVGYSPWGRRESNTTERLHFDFYIIAHCCLVAKSHLTLLWPMDCSPPGSSVHRISQERILEGVALSFSRGSSQLRDWTHVSCLGRWVLYHWVTTETQ